MHLRAHCGRECIILKGKSFGLADNRHKHSGSINQDPSPRATHHLSQGIANHGGKGPTDNSSEGQVTKRGHQLESSHSSIEMNSGLQHLSGQVAL